MSRVQLLRRVDNRFRLVCASARCLSGGLSGQTSSPPHLAPATGASFSVGLVCRSADWLQVRPAVRLCVPGWGESVHQRDSRRLATGIVGEITRAVVSASPVVRVTSQLIGRPPLARDRDRG